MANRVIKPRNNPRDPSYYLAIPFYLLALFPNPNRTGSNLQQNRTRSNSQIKQNSQSQTNQLAQVGKQHEKKEKKKKRVFTPTKPTRS